jgi:hypothetical protein
MFSAFCLLANSAEGFATSFFPRGCGIYNMQMDKAFIEDVVNHAAALVADRGKEAFGQLRDLYWYK